MSSKVHYSLPDRALIPVSGTLIATFPIERVKLRFQIPRVYWYSSIVLGNIAQGLEFSFFLHKIPATNSAIVSSFLSAINKKRRVDSNRE